LADSRCARTGKFTGEELMEALLAIAVGVLTACGVFLILRARTFPVLLGLTLLSYAVNLFLFASGRLRLDAPPLIRAGASYTDPLPQALVLTAIVIGFGMTAYLAMLALRGLAESGPITSTRKRARDRARADPADPDPICRRPVADCLRSPGRSSA
jgi:multicomponent K+:H+ antiporter subunit C